MSYFATALVVSLSAANSCGPGPWGADTPPPRLPPSRYRPQFHFTAPRGWMNDPIRPLKVGATYHLHYQYNPCGANWGNMTWGHATSKDLLTWEDHPVALWPTSSYDRGGVFTGSVLQTGAAEFVAFFTGAALLPISWNLPYTLGMETVLTRPLTHPITHLLTYLLTHTLTHSLTHSLTHTLT